MPAAAANASEEGDMQSWADCQAMVSGYGKFTTIADDHKNCHAYLRRVVRSVVEETSCRISVGKVKTNRNVEDVAEECLED
jgi:hypothetical protein